MMHDHDFALIADLAEGRLSPAEQAAGEASLVSCEACTTDLQLQREALAALREAPTIRMTDLERAALHRNVAAELTPIRQRTDSTSKAPWFQRLMPAMAAAAALLVVVGIGSVLVDGAGDSDAAPETTATAEQALPAAPQDESTGASEGAQFDDAAQPTTTTAAATAPAVSDVQRFGALTKTQLADLADRLGSSEETADVDGFDLRNMASLPTLACGEVAAEEGTITAVGVASVDGEEVEIYRIEGLINVFSAADCTLIDPFE